MTEIPALRLSRGPAGANRLPSSQMAPPSGLTAPLNILIRVLFPAPFSPSRAWASPGRRSKSTSSRARVAPKFLEIRSMLRSGGWLSSISCDARIFGKIGQKKRPDLGVFYVVPGRHVYSHIDDLVDGLTAEMERHKLDAQVAHLSGVLEDEPLDVSVAERLDELRRAVEPDEDDLPGETRLLEGTQRPERARLVGTENPVHVRERADVGVGRHGGRLPLA